MAFVAWRTWVAGAVLTAAQLNQDIRDNLNAWFPLAATNGTALATWTPTLTQSGAVTKTVNYAKYTQVGKMVHFGLELTCTGSGTSNNQVIVGLPVTAATAGSSLLVGTGDIVTTVHIPGIAHLVSTTTMALIDATQAVGVLLGQTGSAFSAALANTNRISIRGSYEAA